MDENIFFSVCEISLFKVDFKRLEIRTEMLYLLVNQNVI